MAVRNGFQNYITLRCVTIYISLLFFHFEIRTAENHTILTMQDILRFRFGPPCASHCVYFVIESYNASEISYLNCVTTKPTAIRNINANTEHSYMAVTTYKLR